VQLKLALPLLGAVALLAALGVAALGTAQEAEAPQVTRTASFALG
jgi:hypothetical protein